MRTEIHIPSSPVLRFRAEIRGRRIRTRVWTEGLSYTYASNLVSRREPGDYRWLGFRDRPQPIDNLSSAGD
jgi:hypothetical protein